MSTTYNMSASKELPQTGEQAFPALFTIDNSSRHESKNSAQLQKETVYTTLLSPS
jgi:hypothetical protein